MEKRTLCWKCASDCDSCGYDVITPKPYKYGECDFCGSAKGVERLIGKRGIKHDK